LQIHLIGFENANAVRLKNRLKERGHTVHIIPAEELYLDVREEGVVVVPYDTRSLPEVIIGLTSTDTMAALDALRYLEAAGVTVINRADGIEKAANKFLTALILKEAGIRHPRVIQVCTENSAQEAGKRLGFPLVLKAHDGSEGSAVFLVKQESDLLPVLAEMRRTCGLDPQSRSRALLQEFLAESVGHDKRVFVLGGKVIAGMERVAQPGEWRSNLSQGAYPRPTSLTTLERDAAVRSVQALGLDFGVVDIMPLQDGPVVIEVNSGGDVVDIVAMAGIDIFQVLCRYIEAKGSENWLGSEELPLVGPAELESELKFAWDRIARKAEELAQRAGTLPL
jgi:ribosomal protein S6--L-glutamate ligase